LTHGTAAEVVFFSERRLYTRWTMIISHNSTVASLSLFHTRSRTVDTEAAFSCNCGSLGVVGRSAESCWPHQANRRRKFSVAAPTSSIRSSGHACLHLSFFTTLPTSSQFSSALRALLALSPLAHVPLPHSRTHAAPVIYHRTKRQYILRRHINFLWAGLCCG
jgi:hypothetical protein